MLIYFILLNVSCLGKGQSTVEITGLREGGNVRGCLITPIMIREDGYIMQTYEH